MSRLLGPGGEAYIEPGRAAASYTEEIVETMSKAGMKATVTRTESGIVVEAVKRVRR